MRMGERVAYQERNRLNLGLTSPLRDPWGIVEGAGLHVLSLQLGREHRIDGIIHAVARRSSLRWGSTLTSGSFARCSPSCTNMRMH